MFRSPSAGETSVSRRPPDLVNGSRFFRGKTKEAKIRMTFQGSSRYFSLREKLDNRMV